MAEELESQKGQLEPPDELKYERLLRQIAQLRYPQEDREAGMTARIESSGTFLHLSRSARRRDSSSSKRRTSPDSRIRPGRKGGGGGWNNPYNPV